MSYAYDVYDLDFSFYSYYQKYDNKFWHDKFQSEYVDVQMSQTWVKEEIEAGADASKFEDDFWNDFEEWIDEYMRGYDD